MFGDTVKDPSSTRIDVGDHFNSVQNGTPLYGTTSTGSSNTYTMNFAEAPIAKVAGQRFYFLADKTNTGACTLTWGAQTDDLKDATGQLALPAGTIRTGDLCEVFYDGTVFRLISATSLANQLGSGWIPFTTTLTYASSSTFTIAGDWTAVLSKGDKLFLSNSGTKFGFITNLSFAAGNTTVTFFAGADYTLANAAITGYYSKSESIPSFPTSFLYTIGSITGFTGTPTQSGRFFLRGSRCFLNALVSGTSNSISFSFGLPVNCATITGNSILSYGTGSDNGSYQNNVLSTISSAGSTVSLNPQGGSANWTNSGAKAGSTHTNYPWA